MNQHAHENIFNLKMLLQNQEAGLEYRLQADHDTSILPLRLKNDNRQTGIYGKEKRKAELHSQPETV